MKSHQNDRSGIKHQDRQTDRHSDTHTLTCSLAHSLTWQVWKLASRKMNGKCISRLENTEYHPCPYNELPTAEGTEQQVLLEVRAKEDCLKKPWEAAQWTDSAHHPPISAQPSHSSSPPLIRNRRLSLWTGWIRRVLNWGTWVAQSVECPTLAQVKISQFVGSSPGSGSVLTARSLEPASDSMSSSFSAPLLLIVSLSLSLSKINMMMKKKKKKKKKKGSKLTEMRHISKWGYYTENRKD